MGSAVQSASLAYVWFELATIGQSGVEAKMYHTPAFTK